MLCDLVRNLLDMISVHFYFIQDEDNLPPPLYSVDGED